MSYTKGPWRVKQEPKKSIWITADDGFYLAEVNKYAASFGNQKDLHNARLMAKAPELLQRLEDSTNRLAAYYGEQYPCVVQNRALIAETKGGQ